MAFGDDLVIEFAVSGGVPAYTCEWYYKMPGSDEFVAPGHNDCETWVINGAMVTGMYEEVDPVDPVDILFKVEVTDALETAVMSNVATITID